jgi:hypothetical protein
MSYGLLIIAISQLVMLFALLFKIRILFFILVCIYMTVFAISIGGILFTFQVEILPSELVSIVSIFLFSSAVVFSQITLPLISSIGLFTLVLILTAFSLIIWVYFEGFAVETINKSKEKIEDEFLLKKFMRD